MAIKRGSKVDKSFSSASMTDLIFLLLLFMLIATTLINPNAIKLILPKSSNQLKDKAMTTISIQDTGIMSRRKTSARARAWRKPSSPGWRDRRTLPFRCIATSRWLSTKWWP